MFLKGSVNVSPARLLPNPEVDAVSTIRRHLHVNSVSHENDLPKLRRVVWAMVMSLAEKESSPIRLCV